MPRTLAQLRPELGELIDPASPLQAEDVSTAGKQTVLIRCIICGGPRPIKAYRLSRQDTSLTCRLCANMNEVDWVKIDRLREAALSQLPSRATLTLSDRLRLACPSCGHKHTSTIRRELRRSLAAVGHCAACRFEQNGEAKDDERERVTCPECKAERMVRASTVQRPGFSAKCKSCVPRNWYTTTVNKSHPSVAGRFSEASPVQASEVTAKSSRRALFECVSCHEDFEPTVANQTRLGARGRCSACRYQA